MTPVPLKAENMESEILIHIESGVGVITLNRPQALNALSLAMIRGLWQTLLAWRNDTQVRVVVLQGAGDKAFCAGGDIRAVYQAGKSENFDICDAFFREEYALNTLIRAYPKPYISLIHGIAMGGGLGVSINGKYRILSESVMMAMPETGIGFFPDVGGTTFLSQAPGKIGLYLALTGARLSAADALYAGLGTHHIPHARWEDFKRDLTQSNDVEGILNKYVQAPPPSELAQEQATIDRHFSGDSVEAILKSLSHDESLFAKKASEILTTKSPLSLKIAFEQITKSPEGASFKDLMKREFRISQHLMHSHDFYEGVRAVLVDKDQKPHWSPHVLEDVTPEMVAAYFAPLDTRELELIS